MSSNPCLTQPQFPIEILSHCVSLLEDSLLTETKTNNRKKTKTCIHTCTYSLSLQSSEFINFFTGTQP